MTGANKHVTKYATPLTDQERFPSMPTLAAFVLIMGF